MDLIVKPRRLFWSSFSFSLLAMAILSGTGPKEPESKEERVLRELVEAHNSARAAAELPPLVANPKLTAAAKLHAADMAKHEKMAHEGSDESTPAQRIERQDYHYRGMGENVAWGQETVRHVMKTWIESPEHKKNILGDFTEMGGAYVPSAKGRYYWCVDFGRPWPAKTQEKAVPELVAALNRARGEAKEKKQPLKVQPKLEQAALKHAQDMAAADKLSHDDADAQDPVGQLKKAGYRFRKLAEELASGESDADVLIKSWLGEKIHRENVLGDFTEIGVGYATTSKGKPYWCVLLAIPQK